MEQFILNKKIHRTETGLCRSRSSWLASDVTFRIGKSALEPHPLHPEIGIFWDLGLGSSNVFKFHA